MVASTGPSPPDSSPQIAREKKRKKKNSTQPGAGDAGLTETQHQDSEAGEAEPASSSSVSAEERLAALGEAFLASIEQAPTKRQQKARNASTGAGAGASSAADVTESSAAGEGSSRSQKKKRRKAARATAEGQSGATAPRAESTDKSPAQKNEKLQPAAKQPTGGPLKTTSSVAARPRVSAAEKRRFMSGKVSDIFSNAKAQTVGRARGSTDEEEEDREFKQTLREVLDFVTPQLGKQQRKQYEEQKLRALGATMDSRQKMPYRMLQEHRKSAEAKRQRKLAQEKTLGVSLSVSKHRKQWGIDQMQHKKKEAAKEKKRRREDGLLRLGLGAREHRGMAVIPQHAVKKYR